MARIAVVTDSYGLSPARTCRSPRPHRRTADRGHRRPGGREGIEITPADVAQALVARRGTVTDVPGQRRRNSRRSTDSYTVLAPTASSPIHLSSKLSGTYEAAVLARGRQRRADPGHRRTIGPAWAFGFAAIAASRGGGFGAQALDAVCDAARVAIDKPTVPVLCGQSWSTYAGRSHRLQRQHSWARPGR